ncbi:golgin subfamily A member 4 [Bactrocera dorsalis]|uniref:Golgin subfamily A member 4 n=1 Tax=Bactrocera dorsalis TaxID=27457 RepID=A0A6I9VX74_BACDO|nr:golgin subfamily A member 4 [Bactrocera dorsalis]
MFANLKNKLIEEVKASPSKFQQFAAAVSSSASTTPSGSESTTTTTTNENFFSITEEDTPQNSPYKPLKLPPGSVGGRTYHNGPIGGAIPRTRKLSNSSMASDVSFRLPTYDSPPVYHLQSDLESNCSELEDTASTAKLEVVTKEQLYDAYKKSLDRYHKYRSRYTDLAKRYKDLERDSTKARSVLVETQEKAIRRISELREQCSLEQQAKAHLEEALRMEMDDMQCKMQAYQTKLKLLGENPDNVSAILLTNESNDTTGGASLIDLDDNNSNTNIAHSEDLNEKKIEDNLESLKNGQDFSQIEQLKKELDNRERKIEELIAKMSNAEDTISQLRKQEEENALLLAQTKQAIHSELENKESEVKRLTIKINEMQKEEQDAAKKEKQLSVQASELNELHEKLKNLHIAKQETDAKLIASEHMLGQMKEQLLVKDNAIKAFEQKLSKGLKDSEQKLDELRQQNVQLNEMLQRYQQNEVSLAEIDNELNRTKNENDILKIATAENERKLHELEEEVRSQKEQLERHQKERAAEEDRRKLMSAREDELTKLWQEVQADNEVQRQIVKRLQVELKISNERNQNNESETITALKTELHMANEELEGKVKTLKDQLAGKEKELKSSANKLAKQKKQFESQQSRIRDQSGEIEMLRTELNKHEQHLTNLQNESQAREQESEAEKTKLKAQVQSILQDITEIQDEMRIVKESHDELEVEKLKLEQRIENMQREAQDTSDDTQLWRDQLIDTEDKLRLVELKLQKVETENSQLAERNCLLEEQNNRFEKQLAERERQKDIEEANANDLRLQLDSNQMTLRKLNEKMSEVLDENSRLHNTQELMDHDYRTLQDKFNALEKEKLMAEDVQIGLQEELEQLREHKLVLENKLRETVEQLQQTEEQCAEQKKNTEAIEKELKEMVIARERLENQNQIMSAELNELRAVQSDDEKLHNLMCEQKRRIEDLEHELIDREKSAKANIEIVDKENKHLNEKLGTLEATREELEVTKKEILLLKSQNEELNRDLCILNTELKQSRDDNQELERQLTPLKALEQEKEISEKEHKTLTDEINKLKEESKMHIEEAQKRALELEEIKQKLHNSSEINEKLENTELEVQKMRELEKKLRADTANDAELANQKIHELEEQLHTAKSDIERLHESNDAIQVEMDKIQNKNELQVQSLEVTIQQLKEHNEKLQQKLASQKVDGEKLANFEQMQIENEYLNKHVKQLETELTAQHTEASSQLQEVQDLREKLKSLQCELYVLRENAEKHDAQLAEKQKVIDSAENERTQLREMLTNERAELERQVVHAKYITEQNDAIQSDLLHKQHQLTEVEQQLHDIKAELEAVNSTHAADIVIKTKEIDSLRSELLQIAVELNAKAQLQEELDALRVELAEHNQLKELQLSQATVENGQKSILASDAENLRRINEALQRELEDLKHKSTSEITELQQEIEDMQSNARHMTEKLAEVEKLHSALTTQQVLANTNADQESLQATREIATGGEISKLKAEEQLQREKAELAAKLREIMNEVRDVSERNLFLEQQCENYLILEQSNERLKLQNAKLSRQLDETLVSMQHNEGITANTEFEYLKNIMFQYLTGSANGNNETLVKVISAVLKFSPQQTQVALEKEHQRRSLINKIL